MNYPSVRYHASKEPRVVHDEEQDQLLGPGWADSPAAFPKQALDPDALSAEMQIEKLAAFILAEVPGEPSADEGAVDTAIRLLRARNEKPQRKVK